MSEYKEVTIPERVYEFREWESHHSRYLRNSIRQIAEDLGKPAVMARYENCEAHIAKMKELILEAIDEFEKQWMAGRLKTPEELRKDR